MPFRGATLIGDETSPTQTVRANHDETPIRGSR